LTKLIMDVRIVGMSSIEVAPDQTKVTGNGSAFYVNMSSQAVR
jgi:hypothetical protein